jgi:cell division protein FtsI/penicillin-binding protein 2
MNIHNGNILSLVSLPDFDPNKRENIKIKIILIKLQKEFMSLVLYLKLLH